MNTDPRLLELLKRAKSLPPMTPEQLREQRISFVYGQLMDCQPNVTKQQIAECHDRMYGPIHITQEIQQTGGE